MAGIYIHIPFCKQACHYCDFHFSTSLKNKTALLGALKKELALRNAELPGEIIETIYFGGGTPSLLTPEELYEILEAVRTHYDVSSAPEITLEANPDDLINDPEVLFQAYSQIGINRLSIGVQSFFEEDLKLMNRAHNAAEAKKCLETATRYFKNISLDLIYGIPGLTNEKWLENIETALSFGIPHISSYALTVEPKTALEHMINKGHVARVDDEQAEEQFHLLVAALEDEGFIHYELSNFGKPEYFSKNNTAYWQGKKYLGIGPSAHSFDGQSRSWNVANNSKYLKALTGDELPLERELLSVTDRYNEYVMTGLRTVWGVSPKYIEQQFGVSYFNYFMQQSKKFLEDDLLTAREQDAEVFIKTSKKGKFLADGIASDLFLLNLQ